jgi:hypothetical protein
MTTGECDRAGVKAMSATKFQKQQYFLSEMLLFF